MVALSAFIGMTILSGVGWWLGAQAGLGTAIVLSGVGAGVGFYYGRKIAKDLLDG